MKHLKSYEHSIEDVPTNPQPQIGDYIYCNTNYTLYKPGKFIGILTKIKPNSETPYRIEYPIKSDDPDRKDRFIRKDEVVAFSKNYDELEQLIKYNL